MGPLFRQLHAEQPDAEVTWDLLGYPRRGRSALEHADAALLTEPPPYPGVSEMLLA